MSDEKKEKIVVLGFGWVGQANAIALVQMGYQVFYYDIVEPKRHYERDFKDWYTKIKPLGQLLEKDDEFTWYIVAVGDRVRDDGTQDTSLIKKSLDELKNARGGIILRSTLLPQNLKELLDRKSVV
jgi:UDP-glucose 6-dehydrogenase